MNADVLSSGRLDQNPIPEVYMSPIVHTAVHHDYYEVRGTDGSFHWLRIPKDTPTKFVSVPKRSAKLRARS